MILKEKELKDERKLLVREKVWVVQGSIARAEYVMGKKIIKIIAMSVIMIIKPAVVPCLHEAALLGTAFILTRMLGISG